LSSATSLVLVVSFAALLPNSALQSAQQRQSSCSSSLSEESNDGQAPENSNNSTPAAGVCYEIVRVDNVPQRETMTTTTLKKLPD
jgi:hypothetical protein